MTGKSDDDLLGMYAKSELSPKTKFSAYVEFVAILSALIISKILWVGGSGGLFFIILDRNSTPNIGESILMTACFFASFIFPMIFYEYLIDRIKHIRSFGKKNPNITSSNFSVQ